MQTAQMTTNSLSDFQHKHYCTTLELCMSNHYITEHLPTALGIDQNKKLNLYSFYNQFLRVWSNSIQDKIKQRLIYVEGTAVARLVNCVHRTWEWLLSEHKSD